MFDLGDTVGLSVTVRDAAGAPTNATTVTLTITKPDGTAAAGITVTNPPSVTGVYVYDYVPTLAGRHTVYWQTTSPATAFSDVFDVRPAASTNLISLKDGKDHLNITSTTDDEEIRTFIAASSRVVTDKIGEVAEKTITATLDGGDWEVALPRWPVTSVTSVTPVLTGGQTVDATDVAVDESGVARSKTGIRFPAGQYVWTYKAGRSTTAENIALATKIILKHMWDTQRGAAPAPYAGGDDQNIGLYSQLTVGFAIPRRALELLAPDEQLAGFA